MVAKLNEILRVSSRTARVVRSAWNNRLKSDLSTWRDDELEFMPENLALIATPPSPLPRWTARLIICLFLLALIWSAVSELELVASGPGIVVSSSRTKIIQSLETAVVSAIYVKDGDVVHQGQVLLALEPTSEASDAEKASGALIAARITKARNDALLRAVTTDTPPAFHWPELASVQEIDQASRLGLEQWQAVQERCNTLKASVSQRHAELATLKSSVAPASSYLDIARTRVSDYESLLSRNYVSKQDYLSRKQEMINAEKDLSQTLHRISEQEAALIGAQHDLETEIAKDKAQFSDAIREASEQVDQLAPELAKANKRRSLMDIRAPVSGTVQQVATHTVGGVVTSAQELMRVVPVDDGIEVESTILNKDIGFVRLGQRVVLKVDSFPFTRYGTVSGHVISISHDAIQDEKLGSIFRARIALRSSRMNIDGAEIQLSPGMTVTAEVDTGKQRVIDYLLSPLKKYTAEALRER